MKDMAIRTQLLLVMGIFLFLLAHPVYSQYNNVSAGYCLFSQLSAGNSDGESLLFDGYNNDIQFALNTPSEISFMGTWFGKKLSCLYFQSIPSDQPTFVLRC